MTERLKEKLIDFYYDDGILLITNREEKAYFLARILFNFFWNFSYVTNKKERENVSFEVPSVTTISRIFVTNFSWFIRFKSSVQLNDNLSQTEPFVTNKILLRKESWKIPNVYANWFFSVSIKNVSCISKFSL